MNRAIRKVGALGMIGVFGFLWVYLNAVFFGYFAASAPLTYIDLTLEDSWVENFTAICLFLAGLLLIATAFMERRALPRCIYILTGIALLFGAGEEISWGQRIFGFHTPDIFMDLNTQFEFNIHNLEFLYLFRGIDHYATLIFCAIIFAAFLYKKDVILGVPVPSIHLVFAFMIVLSHKSFSYAHPSVSYYISLPSVLLLLIFAIYMLFDRKYYLVSAATTIMIPVLIFTYLYSFERGTGLFIAAEIREYLFSFCCFFYSLELLFI